MRDGASTAEGLRASRAGRVYKRSPGARNRLRWAASAATAAALSVAMLVGLPMTQALAAPTSTLDGSTLHVVSSEDATEAITDFRFLINVDNTGSTDLTTPTGVCSPQNAGYPDSCPWPSIGDIGGDTEASPIYTHGDQTDIAAGIDLPDGKYLISVLADGYKIDGQHFSVPFDDAAGVTVQMAPDPLPDSTVRATVYADMNPTNGVQDVGDAPLVGWEGHVNDTLGEISTDVYGNPLCTTYVGENPDTHVIPASALDADGVPVVAKIGGHCLSDQNGLLTIPHLGSNRYTQYVIPPDGEKWVQTTTLEGNHDWDTWVMEGATGFDTEFTLAGEAVPQPQFGFAKPMKNGQPLGGGTGHITGSVVKVNTYTPPTGGGFDFWGGHTGSKVSRPIPYPWLSLSDLTLGDQAVWVGQGNEDGTFDISGVPDGNYNLSWWDEPQDHNLNMLQVTVADGEVVDMGTLIENGWWTEYSGYVFNDKNRNGKKDPGENGIPGFTLTMRKRDNSLMDRGQNTAVTDADGYYYFESAYPLGEWTVMEAYSDSYYTTGITYQTDNQPDPTTIKGAGVDVSTLNIIGLGGKLDWGVHAYDPTGANGIDPRNGGIVGSLSYDTTRNELDPQFAAAEDWQPGIPNVEVDLYATVDCPPGFDPANPGGIACDANALYQVDPDTGAYLQGDLLNTYLSESWQRPTGCTARNVDGDPLVHGTDEDVLARNQETDGECIASFIQGVQFGAYETDQGTPDANFGATVDGNYGFGDGCFNGTIDKTAGGFDPSAPTCAGGDFTALPAGGYLVSLDIPSDASGEPTYKVTGEEDINIGNGDQIVPQVPPPACAGVLHTVDVEGIGADGPNAVHNPTFADIGGSPYEGMDKPRCDTKLVELNNGKSIVPMFNLFTDVPIPSRLRGLIVDDVNFSVDPKSTMYGEKSGVPFVPVGIYDFQNRLVLTTESDYNGVYDVLMPSTDHISCPTPSGVCANMYRFVANDPGVPGALNPNYNPRYRVIATEFEALPGVTIPTDLAPTQVGLTIEAPGTGQLHPVTCPVAPEKPQLFAVSQPYVNGSGSFTIEGLGFGASQGAGTVMLGNTELGVTSWTNTSIEATVPAGTPAGPSQLTITADNGETTANGLTFHVRGPGYNPNLYEVGPGRTYARIQDALNAARTSNGDDLVVVYPGEPDFANPRQNPYGAYYENLIMASPAKLQGVGPGGFQGKTYVPGTIIDAGAYGGDTQLATDWFTLLGSLNWDGNQAANDGEAIYVIASQNVTNAQNRARQFTSGFRAAIDGFTIRGGDQRGFPGNINDLTGGPTGLPPGITTQGGAIFANAYARYLQITNNVVTNNGGAYGTIRIGTPDLPGNQANQHNENVRIAHNRVVANAGTNLAGGIGIFAGSDNYDIGANEICGNFSVEYGGGVSVYGRSPNGKIHHNKIYLNMSNDEGGGIMIAGALPANPNNLSPGSGPVDIYNNEIKANLANDDGGGIRFLMAGGSGGTDAMNVYNNIIADNVSTHEGGGVGINDAPNVRIVNNTIMKNLTTATAVTSNGSAAPAGVSTSQNSDQLQATLPGGAPTFSNPLLFNNILWDNRAGTRAGTTVTGIGLAGDATPVDLWDVGVADGTGTLSPSYSVIDPANGGHAWADGGNNVTSAPAVVDPYDVSVSFATWRQNPAFVDATLVALDAPVDQLGNYRLSASSPAIDTGIDAVGAVNAPLTDIDDGLRPALTGFDIGADEYGATVAPPPPPPNTQGFVFSTVGNSNPPGVSGTADDADLYRWNETDFSRIFDMTADGGLGLLDADVDGIAMVDANRFYVSFNGITYVPGVGLVGEKDILYWDGSSWSKWWDASAHMSFWEYLFGDMGTFTVVGQTLYLTTQNSWNPASGNAFSGGSTVDVYRWDGGSDYTRVVDGSTIGMQNSAEIDGLIYADPDHFRVSFADNTTVAGLSVADEDVVDREAGVWSLSFDGSAHGLSSSALDIDALSLPDGAASGLLAPAEAPAIAATTAPLLLSTVGGTGPAGRMGTARQAERVGGSSPDLYRWNELSSDFSTVNLTSLGVAAGANVDGLDWVDKNLFYLSFADNTRVKGLGRVQDEDVVRYRNGKWSVFFNGTAAGLRRAGQDVDAISVQNGRLYFSVRGNVHLRGLKGRVDNADVIMRQGRRFAKVWDATNHGLPKRADVDGLVRQSTNSRFLLSFAGDSTRVPRLGAVQDEDVVKVEGRNWSLFFDGTPLGLTGRNLDVDAFDIP
jgi:SdrD B-like domain/IPT/TIG domain